MTKKQETSYSLDLSLLDEIIPKLNQESDRGMVLVSGGFLENQLKTTLEAFLREVPSTTRLFDGPTGPFASLSARILACHAMGLINDNEYEDLQIIRKLRNKFAHEIHASFDDTLTRDQCLCLHHGPSNKISAQDGRKIKFPPRLNFMASFAVLAQRLIERPKDACRNKRAEPDFIPEVIHKEERWSENPRPPLK